MEATMYLRARSTLRPVLTLTSMYSPTKAFRKSSSCA
jgi:hypothetical protein